MPLYHEIEGKTATNLPAQDDVLTAGGGDEDVSLLGGFIHGGHFITCRLKGQHKVNTGEKNVNGEVKDIPPSSSYLPWRPAGR